MYRASVSLIAWSVFCLLLLRSKTWSRAALVTLPKRISNGKNKQLWAVSLFALLKYYYNQLYGSNCRKTCVIKLQYSPKLDTNKVKTSCQRLPETLREGKWYDVIEKSRSKLKSLHITFEMAYISTRILEIVQVARVSILLKYAEVARQIDVLSSALSSSNLDGM